MAEEQALITTSEFDYVRTLAKENAALVIEEDKRYLVETRLSTLAQREGFDSLRALIHALRRAEDLGPLHTRAIDALTTNETLFFRDRHPFDALQSHILPQLIETRRYERSLRIWSAASSTGQEPYSIAMLIRDKFPQLLSWKISILGTDLSDRVLEQAKSGCYSQLEVNRGLPAPMLIKFFEQDAAENKWSLRHNIRSMVEFRQLNLIEPWNGLPVFDLVFIRNVLIYFDVPSKRSILERIAKQHLAPGGFLSLGSAETTLTITPVFKPVPAGRAVFFQPTSGA